MTSGRFLAKAGGHAGADTITLYDALSGRMIGKLSGHEAPITGLTLSPDGLLYSVDSRGNVRAWDLEQRCERWRFSMLDWCDQHDLFQEGW